MFISLWQYMKKMFRAHLVGCIKRNQIAKYEGAKPNDKQYNLAIKILKEKQIHNNYNENSNQENLINIVAYFIKYEKYEHYCEENFIDIQKCTSFIYSDTSKKIYRVTLFEPKDVLSLSKILATSPWMGNANDAYLNDIKFLIDKEIIDFIIIKENKRYKVRYKLNSTILQSLNEEVNNIEAAWKNDDIARNDYVFTDEKINFEEIFNMIDEMQPKAYITLKLATFHARTVFNVPEYVQRIKRICEAHPNFIFMVIIIGKKSSKLSREMSERREFIKAYQSGIIDIYKDMEEYQDRIIIRSVRGDDDMARLRGIVLLRNNEIQYCAQYFWRYGNDRGIYRKTLISKSDNTFTRRFNTEFTKVFKESYPENKIMEKIKYRLYKIGAFTLITGTISIFLTWLLDRKLEESEWKNYIISIVVAFVMFLVPQIYYKIKKKFFII